MTFTEIDYLNGKIDRNYQDIDDGFYNDFSYEIKLDTSKNWRIYVSWDVKKEMIMPFNIYEDYDYNDDSSFSLENFPLTLWNYGVTKFDFSESHKIGLDQFPYSELTKEDSKFSSRLKRSLDETTLRHDQVIELAKKLIDCIIEYQSKKEKILEYNRKHQELNDQRNLIKRDF